MTTLKTVTAAAVLLLALPLSAAKFTTNGPTSTNNDDSCDISVMPAATLLVPYFEVDIAAAGGQTTILTVTNTSSLPQSIRITLWTDFAYPVIDFPVYLTGYDVQNVDLFDVIARGLIAPDSGTGFDVSPVGDLSAEDNPLLQEATCVDLPTRVPTVYVERMVSAFTQGKVPPIGSVQGCSGIGGLHANAMGYVTIDVVGVCSASLPTDQTYFSSEIRYDNVLMGDYVQVDGPNHAAQGTPMVHIRAIPEGNTQAARSATNLPNTFYGRYQPAASRTSDARQPLPSTFAARWIAGGPTAFDTFYKVWREVPTSSNAVCSAYAEAGRAPVVEIVRFDEEENPQAGAPTVPILPIPFEVELPATALISSSSELIPPVGGPDVAGWLYFNLHDKRAGTTASQNWIVTSMRAEGRFSVDLDALALGNGCTPVTPVSNANGGTVPIGPGPNVTP